MRAAGPADPGTEAPAGHGLWPPGRERMPPRFVAGRPVSPVTRAFLARAAERMAAEGVRVPVVIRDDAAWHAGREVRGRIGGHDCRAGRDGGCRPPVCRLPGKGPRLDPVEPRWGHGTRAVVEPAREPSGGEPKRRLCHHYHCPLLEPLALQLA